MEDVRAKKKKRQEDEDASAAKTGTPCFLAAAPFFLLSTVLFYYVFTENYNFKWTLVLILSGCLILMPGAVFLMLGMNCIATGYEGKLDDDHTDYSQQMESKHKPQIFSNLPHPEWQTIPVQSDDPTLTKMTATYP